MKLSVSIIIPTFNEANYLPRLLRSIQNQTVLPAEIIVADGFSTDATREIAREYGCKVVDGGTPAKGRNNGANAATQPFLLFLDSDVILPPYFLEETFSEMMKRGLHVASCYPSPITSVKLDHYLHEAVNYYIKLTNGFYPHAPGFCIFAKKAIHKKLNGFDESLVLGEDHNYVKRARKIGKFAYLRSNKIPVFVRRLSKEGRLRLVSKYTWVEFYRFFGNEVRKDYFTYQFGEHN